VKTGDLERRELDETALASFLTRAGAWPRGGLQATRIEAGGSNELFELRGEGPPLVLRRPPAVRSAPGAHDVIRETRVLAALDATAVPHPRLVAVCDDLSIIGSPFYVMEHVDGFAARHPIPEPFCGRDALREIAMCAIDALASIANLDWSKLGLDGFGRPEGFLERQVPRWLAQLERYRSRELPHLEKVSDWLERNRPRSEAAALLHGDFQLVNLMYRDVRPTVVAAVLDWEMSTIGDPLADLGWFLAGWEEPGESSYRSYPQLTSRPGMPTRQELATRYAVATGLSIDALAYYEVLALFKLACIMEGSYFRYSRGDSSNPLHASLEAGVPAMLERALAFSNGTLG
jgi:aminoglycoside phosphotransferase (APT) family kinase protein